MYLYTMHGSSGTRHTSDEVSFYFTDVEKPTAENPVKYAISVTIKGIDSLLLYGEIETIGRVAVMEWDDKNEEKEFVHYIVKFPKKFLIGFLNDIQTDHILFCAGDYNAVEVDVNSAEFRNFIYPQTKKGN